MLDILCGEESGTKCRERRDQPSIANIHNRYLSTIFYLEWGYSNYSRSLWWDYKDQDETK